MPKRQVLVMKLFSRRPLNEDAAGVQLHALIAFADGVFTPEKCDVYEPLRETFDPDNLREPIRWLSQPGGEMKFRRSRPIRVEGFIQNARFPKFWFQDAHGRPVEFEPRVAEPIFCTRWVVWINAAAALKKGAHFLKQFLIDMFSAAAADYGFLAADTDYREKNFLVVEDEHSIRKKFVGDDPEKGLPGLYWMNLFGPLYADWFGREGMRKVPATTVEELEDGSLFIQFGESPADSETPETRQQQQMTVRILGEDAFFDISRPERTLSVPDFGQ